MDEFHYLPATLNYLHGQSLKNFTIFICVNQPDDWWSNPQKEQICINNIKTIDFLKKYQKKCSNVVIIDKSSKSNGWKGNKHGVGFARKLLMDKISEIANDNDIIVSMDSDVKIGQEYLFTVVNILNSNPKSVALANPYYHELTGSEDIDRPMLRYEIYMRNYNINMLRINSPYSYTALGSVISLPVWAYKKVRGITPKQSGEDFYFLQKLRKSGNVLYYNDSIVYPAARKSGRVPFGTGPAIEKPVEEQKISYPIFHYTLFDEINETYKLFGELFYKNIKTPMTGFFKSIFKSDDIFTSLRKNYKSKEKFIHACHNKIDGLRVYQYLKWRSSTSPFSENKSMNDLLHLLYSNGFISKEEVVEVTFASTDISKLNDCRDLLFEVENVLRKKHYDEQADTT